MKYNKPSFSSLLFFFVNTKMPPTMCECMTASDEILKPILEFKCFFVLFIVGTLNLQRIIRYGWKCVFFKEKISQQICLKRIMW